MSCFHNQNQSVERWKGLVDALALAAGIATALLLVHVMYLLRGPGLKTRNSLESPDEDNTEQPLQRRRRIQITEDRQSSSNTSGAAGGKSIPREFSYLPKNVFLDDMLDARVDKPVNILDQQSIHSRVELSSVNALEFRRKNPSVESSPPLPLKSEPSSQKNSADESLGSRDSSASNVDDPESMDQAGRLAAKRGGKEKKKRGDAKKKARTTSSSSVESPQAAAGVSGGNSEKLFQENTLPTNHSNSADTANSSHLKPSPEASSVSSSGQESTAKPGSSINSLLLPPPIHTGPTGQQPPEHPSTSESSHALDTLVGDIVDFDTFDKLLDSTESFPPDGSLVGSSGRGKPGGVNSYGLQRETFDNISSSSPSHSFLSQGFHPNRSPLGTSMAPTTTPPGGTLLPTPPSNLHSTPESSPMNGFFDQISPKNNFSLPLPESPPTDEDDDSSFLDMLTMPWEDMESRFGSISRLSTMEKRKTSLRSSPTSPSRGHNINSLNKTLMSSTETTIPPYPASSSQLPSNVSTSNVTFSAQNMSPSSLSRVLHLGSNHTSIAPALSSSPRRPPAGPPTSNHGNKTGQGKPAVPMLPQQEENLFFGANGIFGIQPNSSASSVNAVNHPIPVSSTTNIAPGLSPALMRPSYGVNGSAGGRDYRKNNPSSYSSYQRDHKKSSPKK